MHQLTDEKRQKRKDIASLILHILILRMTILAVIMRFAGLRFFKPTAAASDYTALRYFTVESNILIGFISIICIVYDLLRLLKKIEKRPKWLDITEFVGASCLALTMVTILLILGPGVAIKDGNIDSFFNLYRNHNLLFHLLTPVASIAVFLLNADKKLDYKLILIALIPAIAYEIFYASTAISHMDANGKVPFAYDWYGFMQGGLWLGIIAVIVMAGLMALLSFLLLFFYRKIAKPREA